LLTQDLRPQFSSSAASARWHDVVMLAPSRSAQKRCRLKPPQASTMCPTNSAPDPVPSVLPQPAQSRPKHSKAT